MSCRISQSTIDGMKAIYLENELLRVGVLPGRGSDIFEFRYKPHDIDFLLRLEKGPRNPQRNFSQIRNTKSQFEDYYYGGWQICLPNSAPFNYRGAELGQHGEVALIPWTAEVLEEQDDRVSIKCTASILRVPITIERTLSLSSGSASLTIGERVTNTGATHLDVMWGQHIAFGLPFLSEGVIIDTNARTMETEPTMPEYHRFKRGEVYQWPLALNKSGSEDNASLVPPVGEAAYSDLCYLGGYSDSAFYTIYNEALKLGFGLQWDGSLFRNLWLWQERNATKGFPWWGDCYTVALEPWTSRWTGEPQRAIDNNEWLRLEARQSVSTNIKATAFENKFKPEVV